MIIVATKTKGVMFDDPETKKLLVQARADYAQAKDFKDSLKALHEKLNKTSKTAVPGQRNGRV